MIDPVSIAAIALGTATIGSLVGLHLGKVTVRQVGKWKASPDVLVSESAAVTLEEARAAVAWWELRGWQFGKVLSTTREFGPVPGAIFIGPLDENWLEGSAGRAWWAVDYASAADDEAELVDLTMAEDVIEVATGYIKHAVVVVDPLASDKAAVLRHELGHALGYMHAETALLGRRKRASKNGKHQVGQPRLRIVGRPTGHVMNPLLSAGGEKTKGMTPPTK